MAGKSGNRPMSRSGSYGASSPRLVPPLVYSYSLASRCAGNCALCCFRKRLVSSLVLSFYNCLASALTISYDLELARCRLAVPCCSLFVSDSQNAATDNLFARTREYRRMAPRRPHNKSRNGCDTCKQRRVKVPYVF